MAVLCLAGSLPLLSGCAGLTSEGVTGAAQVRFVQVSPSSPEMDFYVNGVGAAYGIGYESFTSYLPVSPGTASLTVNRAGLGLALGAAQGSLAAGRQYTLVVSRGLDSLQEHLYPDQETPAPAGSAAVRILNEVEGPGAITVFVNAVSAGAATEATATFPVTAGAASGYRTLPAGSYAIEATTDEGRLHVPLTTVAVKAGSGAVRTVVFSGVVAASGHGRVVGFSLDDADAP